MKKLLLAIFLVLLTKSVILSTPIFDGDLNETSKGNSGITRIFGKWVNSLATATQNDNGRIWVVLTSATNPPNVDSLFIFNSDNYGLSWNLQIKRKFVQISPNNKINDLELLNDGSNWWLFFTGSHIDADTTYKIFIERYKSDGSQHYFEEFPTIINGSLSIPTITSDFPLAASDAKLFLISTLETTTHSADKGFKISNPYSGNPNLTDQNKINVPSIQNCYSHYVPIASTGQHQLDIGYMEIDNQKLVVTCYRINRNEIYITKSNDYMETIPETDSLGLSNISLSNEVKISSYDKYGAIVTSNSASSKTTRPIVFTTNNGFESVTYNYLETSLINSGNQVEVLSLKDSLNPSRFYFGWRHSSNRPVNRNGQYIGNAFTLSNQVFMDNVNFIYGFMGKPGIIDGSCFHIYTGQGNAGIYASFGCDNNHVGIQSNETPVRYSLSQNYPNPFNPSTSIRFGIPKSGVVKLTIYDVLGKEVSTLINDKRDPGTYIVDFNATGLNSGIYFYTIRAGDFVETKKMILIK